jgi:hypothetical protein
MAALLLIAYYAIHKPISEGGLASAGAGIRALFESNIRPELALQHLAGAALDLLSVAALMSVCGGIGRFLLRRGFTGESVSGSQLGDAALATLIGSGVVSALALAAALAGWLNAVVLWSIVFFIGALIWKDALAWLRTMAGLRHFIPGGQKREGALYRGLISFFLLTSLLIALAPPYSWDSMVYHLVGPQRWLDAGRMAAYADNFYLGFPKSLEMLFTITMSAFGRDTPPALIHWSFGILSLILSAALVRPFTDRRAALIVALLLLTSYNIWELFGWGYVDLAIMAYSAACFTLIMRWRATQDWRLLALIGVLIGFATGIKFTTAFLVASIGVFVLLSAPRSVLRHGLIISIPALLCASPWLLRAWVLYGNPVFPLLGFGLNWDAVRYEAFTREGFGMLSEPTAWQLIFLPLTATIFGYNLGPDTSFTLGPFLLTLGLLLPLIWRWLDEGQRKLARSLIVLALPIIALWTYLAATSNTGEQTRLAIALLPLGAALAGLFFNAIARFPRKPLDIGFLMRALLLLTSLLAAFEVLLAVLDHRPINYFAGTADAKSYLAYNLGVWDGAMDALGELAPGSQVRMLWELRNYHCPQTIVCIPDIMLDQWAYPLARGETPDQIFASWRAQGDDYLLLYHLGYAFFTEDDTYSRQENLQFPAALDSHMTPIWTDALGTYSLYTWK